MRVKGIQRVKDPFKVPWNFLGNARIARLMEVLTLPHTHEEPMQKPLGPVCVCVCVLIMHCIPCLLKHVRQSYHLVFSHIGHQWSSWHPAQQQKDLRRSQVIETAPLCGPAGQWKVDPSQSPNPSEPIRTSQSWLRLHMC